MQNRNKKIVAYTLSEEAREAIFEIAHENRRSMSAQIEFFILSEMEKMKLEKETQQSA